MTFLHCMESTTFQIVFTFISCPRSMSNVIKKHFVQVRAGLTVQYSNSILRSSLGQPYQIGGSNPLVNLIIYIPRHFLWRADPNLFSLIHNDCNVCIVDEGKINILFYSILFYSILFYSSTFVLYSRKACLLPYLPLNFRVFTVKEAHEAFPPWSLSFQEKH